MIARIHHLKHGTEYVLQYTCQTDTIELRILKHTLLGRFPNYFRHEFGTYVREMDAFGNILRNWRPLSGLCPHPDYLPQLSAEEKVLIHEFEQIANINLMLTPESENRFYQTAMQGAANGFNASLESLREVASNMQGLDMNPLLGYMNGRVSRQLAAFAASADMLAFPRRYADEEAVAQEENESNTSIRQRLRREMAEYFLSTGDLEQRLSDPPDPPPPTNAPPIAQETPDVNTEGMTEEEIQENEEFIQRLLNGETISAREFPLRNRDRSEETPQDAEADLDAFLNKIDDTLETAGSDADTIRAAPSHHPAIPVETMMHLWRQARRDED